MSTNELPAAEAGQFRPLTAAGFRQDLSGLEDRGLLAMAGSVRRSGERRAAARDLLAARYGNLVRSCAQSSAHSPEPAEGLMQVGYVGLPKAINKLRPCAWLRPGHRDRRPGSRDDDY
jgi:hypothetical protein